jgi:hypothetical protein
MSEPMSPSVGMAVLHLFGHPAAEFDGQAVISAVKDRTRSRRASGERVHAWPQGRCCLYGSCFRHA